MRKSKTKFIATIILVVAILGVIAGVIGYYSNGFKNWDKFNPKNWFEKPVPPAIAEVEDVASGMVVNLSYDEGSTFEKYKISQEDFENQNIPATVESAYSLTATINAVSEKNMQVDWTVSWLNDNGWSSEKNVSDYVTLDKSTCKSGESVILMCHQDFGKQIIVTANANVDINKFAICEVDYIKKVVKMDYTFKSGEEEIFDYVLDDNNIYRFDYNGEFNQYTIVPNPIYSNFTIDKVFEWNITGKFTKEFHSGNNSVDNFFFETGINKFYYDNPMSDLASQAHFLYLDIMQAMPRGNAEILYSRVENLVVNFMRIYNNLSDSDKNHSLIKGAYSAFFYLENQVKGNTLYMLNYRHTVEMERLYSIPKPVLFKYKYMQQLIYDSEINFLQKCLNSNNANKGVVEYTIKYIDGGIENIATMSIGFTTESIDLILGVDIDNPSIEF